MEMNKQDLIHEKTSEKIVFSGIMEENKMNKQDLILESAKLAEWHVEGLNILTPDWVLYSAIEISSGFMSGVKVDRWEECHKHLLFDQAIEKINKNFRDKKSKLYVSLNPDAYVLFDKDQHHYGVGYILKDDTYKAKEDILQKYFNEVKNEL